jgi:protein-S-isoprenylcysteine O-methyltransferase Ste14
MPFTSDVTTTEATPPDVAAERGPGVALPPTVSFGAGFVLAWWVHTVEPLPLTAGGRGGLASVGWVLVAGGIALFLWALRVFFLARTGIMLQKPATALMMQGPYAWSRNPQYVAFTAMYVGAAFITNTVWPLVLLAPVIVLVVHTVIEREERYLRSTFGESYVDYCRKVGRWV